MPIDKLTYPALMKSIDTYTRKVIRFILRGERGQEYASCKKILESLLNESKRREMNAPA